MAQAGMHGLVGMAVRKMAGRKEWLMLGLILGSFVPDMDNIGVAVATLTKMSTEGIHRTLTHSIFFAISVALVFYVYGQITKATRWSNLGLGLGLGILLHSLLDFVLWFDGVAFFWPLGSMINFWPNGNPSALFKDFLWWAAEFLFFGLYLWALGMWSGKFGTDSGSQGSLRFWMWLEYALFVVFTAIVLFAGTSKMVQTLSGALYLVSLFAVFFVTIRMRKTVEAAVG